MKVLDLFAGLGGWSEPFRERGHDVLTLDNDPRFGCDFTEDILTWDPNTCGARPDVILASPPCETFSGPESAAERAKIPHALALAVCLAAERDL